MPVAQRKLFADAMKLPVKAKVQLVRRLLDGIEAENLESVQSAWKAEILRRVRALERGEVGLHSGDEVLRALKQKYAK
jgi:putative addiction module component (TIGR02574 family)